MNRTELVKAVSNATGFTQKDVKKVVEATLDQICVGLKIDGKVSLTGFGNFSVNERKARKGRNPQTGEELQIPEKLVPKFKAGKSLQEAALQFDPEAEKEELNEDEELEDELEEEEE